MKYHPGVISALTAVRDPAAGHCQVGSLTGAVASNWGSPAATLEALSGCLLGHPSPGSRNRNPLPIHNLRSEASGATHPRERAVKMRPVRTISREVFVTPQRLYAGHPFGMVRQSELPSDRKLSDQRREKRACARILCEHNCLKGNGGAQRYPQAGWKSASECKGIRVLDCEAYTPSRDESRA